MRPIRLSYSGPSSGAPVDVNNVGSFFNVTVSGTGALQQSTDDPFNQTPGTIWTTVSPGFINMPVTMFRMASGQGVLTIVQQGIR